MQLYLQVQNILHFPLNKTQIVLMFGSPPSNTCQLTIELNSTASLTEFFKLLQIQMEEKHLVPLRYSIQYNQFNSIVHMPVLSLLEQFSIIEIMSEELYQKDQIIPMESESPGSMVEKVQNVSCHRCKTRKNECYRCPVNPKHKFCYNCIIKYTTLEKFLTDGCPICENKCDCASCKRRELKRIGIEAPVPKR